MLTWLFATWLFEGCFGLLDVCSGPAAAGGLVLRLLEARELIGASSSSDELLSLSSLSESFEGLTNFSLNLRLPVRAFTQPIALQLPWSSPSEGL
jgi:hypothetical protein